MQNAPVRRAVTLGARSDSLAATTRGLTLFLFTVAAIIGQNRHGVIDTVGRIVWFSFLACALVLVVASVATIARRGGRRVGS